MRNRLVGGQEVAPIAGIEHPRHGLRSRCHPEFQSRERSFEQQLSLLEEEPGVVLLRRSGRKLALTPQAQMLVAHTTELLAALERAEATLSSTLPTISGTVHLTMFQSTVLALMPATPGNLARRTSRHPRRDHPIRT
ncbi:LysR family transcriptional regulator [Arthrobacter roseus]|uniref:LysR family transcriptional regulator n=1 Tax=Arthrobacter roseus TaxID=136274 RepID=UPI001965D6C8|nr:LysR family transcriptional regulator [Arthrobacter roseus]MBM7848730.1 DNA-binding transcriptional LysR family regulator [Arthrobacter roseus]